MIDVPSGTVTFLFTDIEGSTKLWERYPDTMKSVVARHDVMLRMTIKKHDGYVFKTVGDAFCAAFSAAPNAVEAALDVQRALRSEPWDAQIGVLRVRIGLHTGLTEERDGDYFGPPVNRVARLMSAGHGEQIILSLTTEELVRDYLPAGVTLRDLGQHRLKDLIRPEQIFQLLSADLPADFPPLRTLDRFSTNLPIQITSFIGRQKEIGEIKALLVSSRLVTLSGAGGTGKTRLSLQAAADLLDVYADGVWFVELAPLVDPSFIPQTVATVLGLREDPGHSMLTTLTDYLRDKNMLLILDNCEHLVNACAQLAETLLRACPNVRLLISSREPLGLTGEVVYLVPTLSIPDTRHIHSIETLTQYEAVRLFIDRAQMVLPTFTVTNANAPSLAQVCYRLDGIPLAIELAAARVNVLRVEQIEARLDDRFRLLTGGSRAALPRQQTLRALIDWSYDLLSNLDQTLLQRLSVFSGSWTLEAAEVIGAGDTIDSRDVLDLMTQLVNKSLVIVERGQGEEIRCRLLDTIQQYAEEKLVAAGERDSVRDKHLGYFMGLAERAEPELSRPDQVAWLSRLEAEFDNINAALQWSSARNVEAGLRLASALGANALASFWMVQGYSDGNAWLGKLLAQPAALTRNTVQAKALSVQSRMAQWLGNPSRSRVLAEESGAIYRELGDQRGLAVSLGLLGMAANDQGDFALARSVAAQSLALYRELDDKVGLADILDKLGHGIDNQDYRRARAYLDESLALHRELGDIHGVFHILQALGDLAIWQRDYALARPWYEEGLALSRLLGKMNPLQSLDAIGAMAFWQGDYEQARAHYEEMLAMTKDMGYRAWSFAHLGWALLKQGDLTSARVQFKEALHRFNQSGWKIGVIYTLERLASLAVREVHPERAARVLGWAEAMREAIDNRRPPVEQDDVDQDIATIHSQMDESAFSALWAEGRALTMGQAIDDALGA